MSLALCSSAAAFVQAASRSEISTLRAQQAVSSLKHSQQQQQQCRTAAIRLRAGVSMAAALGSITRTAPSKEKEQQDLLLPPPMTSAMAGAISMPQPQPQAPLSLLLAPPTMYENAVKVGSSKARLPLQQILTLGVVSGCHIGAGALLAFTVGGNCAGLATSNPGAQKFLLGAGMSHLSHCDPETDQLECMQPDRVRV